MAEEEKDDKYIVCLTVQMGLWNPRAVAEGSVEKQCGGCGVAVWLSKSGQKMLKDTPDAQLRCEPCIRKMAQAATEEVKVQEVPGAIEEALDNIRRQQEKKD